MLTLGLGHDAPEMMCRRRYSAASASPPNAEVSVSTSAVRMLLSSACGFCIMLDGGVEASTCQVLKNETRQAVSDLRSQAGDLVVCQAMEAWHGCVWGLECFFIHHVALAVGEWCKLRVEG